MKSKFALLMALGALVVLAVPASSMAMMSPYYQPFEITSTGEQPYETGYKPEIVTSLGSCPIKKISGTIVPAKPFSIPAPLVGVCSSGTTMTLSGEWKWNYGTTTTGAYGVAYGGTMTLSFASLPGCSLSGPYGLLGSWTEPHESGNKIYPSTYHPETTQPLSWSAEAGKTCALAGKTEAVTWESRPSAPGPVAFRVIDPYSPSTLIRLNP